MRSSIKTSALFFIIGLAFILPQYCLSGFRSKLSFSLHLADTTGWQWADSLDAVKAAPNSHKVLFENDKIRILEVTVDPYGFEPMHTHRYPSVMFGPDDDSSRYDIIYYRYVYDSSKHSYSVKDSILQHGGGQSERSNKGHFINPEGPHRIKNLSNARIVAYRVEFKQ